jgi:hypothetical protein
MTRGARPATTAAAAYEKAVVTYPGYTRDAIERVAWTAVQVAAGAALSELTTDDAWTWYTLAYAVAIAVLKVLAAHQIGGATARALPGHHDVVTTVPEQAVRRRKGRGR